MRIVKIVAVSAVGLLAANTVANLTINKVRNSTGTKRVLHDAARVVATPAVVTYRRAGTSAA